MPGVVYLADHGSATFEANRVAVDVICVGDSITGWNNFGPPREWPCRTYTEFLQRRCEPLGWLVADVGIAGEVSGNGVHHVREALRLFPNARFVVVGFGTNDLGMWPDVERTSPRVIANIDAMIASIREDGRQPVLLNVPPANGSLFSRSNAEELRRHRAFHNARLAARAEELEIPLVDLIPPLRDEHFADGLHPNQAGAEIIAGEVYRVLGGLWHESTPPRLGAT